MHDQRGTCDKFTQWSNLKAGSVSIRYFVSVFTNIIYCNVWLKCILICPGSFVINYHEIHVNTCLLVFVFHHINDGKESKKETNKQKIRKDRLKIEW